MKKFRQKSNTLVDGFEKNRRKTNKYYKCNFRRLNLLKKAQNYDLNMKNRKFCQSPPTLMDVVRNRKKKEQSNKHK